VGLVRMGDEALAALPNHFSEAHGLRITADHGYVRLRDIALAAIEDIGKVEMRGKPEIAATDGNAPTLKTRVTLDVIEFERRFQPKDLVLGEEIHEGQAVL